MSDPKKLADILSRKHLLIFDFDGTLVDSSPLHARAFNEAFAPHGVAVDYAAIAGLSTVAAVDRIVDREGLDLDRGERERLVHHKQSRARALIAEELEPIEGSIDFVVRAADRFALALCSSASRRTLELSLPKVGLDGRFRPIISAEDVTRGKPDPDAFLAALRFHQAKAADALVFEDSDSGIAAARSAGIEAVRIAGAKDWATLNEALDLMAS